MPESLKVKKLLVKRPITLDGRTIKYDENRQVEFSKSILPFSALNGLEEENASLPDAFKMEIQVVEVAEDVWNVDSVEKAKTINTNTTESIIQEKKLNKKL